MDTSIYTLRHPLMLLVIVFLISPAMSPMPAHPHLASALAPSGRVENGGGPTRGYIYSVAILTNLTDITVQWPSESYSEIPFQVMNTGKAPDSYTFEVDTGISPFSGWTAPSKTDILMPGDKAVVYLRLLPPEKVTSLVDITYDIKVKCVSTTNPAIYDTATFRAVLDIPAVEIREMSMKSSGVKVGEDVGIELTLLSSDRAVENLTIIIYGNDQEIARKKGVSLGENESRTVVMSFRPKSEGPYKVKCVVDLNGVNLTTRESTIFVDERSAAAGDYILPAVLIAVAVVLTAAVFWRVRLGKN